MAIARGFFGVVEITERAERVGAGVEQEREQTAETDDQNDAEAAIGSRGVASCIAHRGRRIWGGGVHG